MFFLDLKTCLEDKQFFSSLTFGCFLNSYFRHILIWNCNFVCGKCLKSFQIFFVYFEISISPKCFESILSALLKVFIYLSKFELKHNGIESTLTFK